MNLMAIYLENFKLYVFWLPIYHAPSPCLTHWLYYGKAAGVQNGWNT